MSEVNITLSVVLEEGDFIQIDDHVYTTKASLLNEETKIHVVDRCCLEILKEFEGNITQGIVEEWLLLSKALDQSCRFGNSWDDRKILIELIQGRQHPVAWYVSNCRVN